MPKKGDGGHPCLRKGTGTFIHVNRAKTKGACPLSWAWMPPLTIQALQNDPDQGVRYKAATVLQMLGDESALPALRRAVETDIGTDWEGRTIKNASSNAIEAIEKRMQGKSSKSK